MLYRAFAIPETVSQSGNSTKYCHARESGHPQIPENTGFRVALRLHGMTL
jgi:hypothetical protein